MKGDSALSILRLPLLATAMACGLAACTATGPIHSDERPYYERVDRQTTTEFTVEAAALSEAESVAVFGVPLNSIDVQPVWVRVENNSERSQWLFPIGIDKDYFPIHEVARRASALAPTDTYELFRRLDNVQLRYYIPPGSVAAGFVFAHTDEGIKAFDVELHGPNAVHRFHFAVPVPGLPAKYFDLNPSGIYVDAAVADLTLVQFKNWIESLGCCTTSADGLEGDPLNIVIVGPLDRVREALISQDWDVTAPISNASLWRMATAFVFGSRYRYAPISPLYLFGREQDLAFQKARTLIDERNHMRLWLAPMTVDNTPVWVGQISRDIGVKLTGRFWPPVTHVIDPDVDEARFYILQDLLSGKWVDRLGFARGHRPSDMAHPHHNAEGDPYFTDGARAVFFISDVPVDPPKIELLDWRLPAIMTPYRDQYLN